MQKEPTKTNLLNQNNNEPKNEHGVDISLEQHIIEQIKLHQGKSKYRICKERPMLIPFTENEIQVMVEDTGLSSEELKKQGKLVHYLYQIQAIKEFQTAKKVVQIGEYGGFVSSTASLNFLDGSWIEPSVIILNGGFVTGDSYIAGNVIVHGVLTLDNNTHIDTTNMNEGLILDHHGVYLTEKKVFNAFDETYSNESIQEALNHHWIRNQIASRVIPQTLGVRHV